MSSVVQNLLDGIIGEGARSTKFECYINFVDPNLISKEKEVYALVKTSQFPGKGHDVIDLKFKGRTIPIKGQVKYDNTWTCTFYTTQDHELKLALENWIESLDQTHNIKNVDSEVHNAQITNYKNGYDTTLRIAQLDFHGTKEIIRYDLHHAFPKSVSAVDVDYSAVGTITEFTVEFSYAYYNSEIVGKTTNTITEELRQQSKNYINQIGDGLKQKISSLFNSVAGDKVSSAMNSLNSGLKTTKSKLSKMATVKDWSN